MMRRGMFGAQPTALASMVANVRAPERPEVGLLGGEQPVQMTTVAPGPMPTMQPMQPKPGFGDAGGLGEKLGAIGGVFMNLGGMRNDAYGDFMAMRQHRARQQQQLAQLADERAYREQEWSRQKEWERDNPEPRAPYRWEANDGSLMEVGPDGRPVVVYKDPTPKVNWIRADNGDGSFSMVPVGPNGPIGGAPAANGTPTAPVGKLKPYGGPTQPASGDFQR